MFIEFLHYRHWEFKTETVSALRTLDSRRERTIHRIYKDVSKVMIRAMSPDKAGDEKF